MRMRMLFLLSLIFFNQETMGSDLPDEGDQEYVGKVVEKTACETYLRINQSGLWEYPHSSDKNGRLIKTQSSEWETQVRGVLNKGNFQVETVLIKKRECLLSQALKNLEESPSSLECLLVINFVSLKCLERLLGEENFNKLCQQWEEKYNQSFYISHITYNPLSYLFFDLNRVSISNWKGRGGFSYLANDPMYRKMALPTDIGLGSNIVQSGIDEDGNPLFIGFHYTEALSLKTIMTILQNDFNTVAKARGKSITWDQQAFWATNDRPETYIRTFSSRLIKAYCATVSIVDAERNNADVLRKFPQPEVVPEDALNAYLLQAFIEKFKGFR